MSSDAELQSLSQFLNRNKSKRYNEANMLFDSPYVLSGKKDRQWLHMMLCLKIVNNEINNYQKSQSLFEFLQLPITSNRK